MKPWPMLVGALVVVLAAPVAPARAQSLDAASREALAATLRMLQDPAERSAAIAGNREASAIDRQLRGIAGSDALMEEFYGLAAQVFTELVQANGGDVSRLEAALAGGRQDPSAFAAMLSPATLQRLRELATKLSDQRR